jgi:hypothetical protein
VIQQVQELLGESLLNCPASGSRLMRWREMHELMELTGGTVYLRRCDWRIIPRRHSRLFVKVTLMKD